eukprot:6259471-Pyramimonas_sp.AAC.1
MMAGKMQAAWDGLNLRKAAQTLGYPQETLDVSIARAMVDGKSLTKKARSTLVCFLAQCIWTRTRLRQAGYEVEGACQCGAQQLSLIHISEPTRPEPI